MTKESEIWNGRRRATLLVCGCTLFAMLVLVHARWRVTFVSGVSMQPTLMTGDLLIINTDVYSEADPERGDLVVVTDRDGLIVKRVVGLPGEEVEIKEGLLYIDDVAVPENAIEPGPLNIGKGRLFEGKFAMLGDNRALPPSQIVHAIVTKERIVGKVIHTIHLSGRKSRAGRSPES